MKTDAIFQKAREGLNRLKLHWKTPPDGYFVNYREFLNLALGSGSLSFLSVIISWTTIAINIPMMISYFKVSTGFIFVAGIIASVLGLIRAPILSMLIDNSNYKKGKFKPFFRGVRFSPCCASRLFPLYRKAGLRRPSLASISLRCRYSALQRHTLT